MSKTIELKVARRVRGFEGRAKAAEENAARLYEQVKAMRAEIGAMTERTGAEFKALRELVESVSATVAQFDQAAQGRMDSIAARVVALEEAAKPAPDAESGTEAETDASIEPEYVCPPNHEDE